MSDQISESTGDEADIARIGLPDLMACLRLGWQDFRHSLGFGLFFSAVYVLGGWMLLWAMTTKGQLWWTLPASAGFPILGPFIACGFYEISRRRAEGMPLTWGGVLGVIFRQKDRQIPAMAAVIVVFFLFWNFLAHMIFALFLGTATMTDISTTLTVFATPNGMMMLVVGTGVGAVFASLLFSLTVVAIPMLLDREVDFVTAMITSVAVVRENPVTMFIWGGVIAVVIFAAMVPWFLGLFLALPVLGHASWHLYTRALQ